MTAAERLFGRLEPLAYDDDGTLEALCTALMAPIEIAEIARDSVPENPGELVTNADFATTDMPGWGTTGFSLTTGAVITGDAGFGEFTVANNNEGVNYAPAGIATFYAGTRYYARVDVRHAIDAGTLELVLGSTADDYASIDTVTTGTFTTLTVSWTPTANRSATNHGIAVRYKGGAMFPIFDVDNASLTHDDLPGHIAWSKLRDPDACPAELLPWLAVDQGIVYPASALTEAEQRYRITQAAGRYRCTPRAVVEELQITLTGTRTVLLGYFTPDQWHYTVGTIDSETPDADAVERAVLAQKPVGMLVDVVLTSDWSYFVIAPTLVGTVDDDGNYVIGTPTYSDYQSLIDTFSDYQHLLDNDPDL